MKMHFHMSPSIIIMEKEPKNILSRYHEITDSFLRQVNALVWFLGRHAFAVILCLFLVSILVGGCLLLRHNSLIARESESANSLVKFQESIYFAVVKEREDRQKFIETPPEKKYATPFQ